MNETQFKQKVYRMLKKEFPHVFFFKTDSPSISGLPDLVLCKDGKFIGIELKAGKNKATKLQDYIIDKIVSSGGRAGVCYTLDDVRFCLK